MNKVIKLLNRNPCDNIKLVCYFVQRNRDYLRAFIEEADDTRNEM